MTEYHVYLHSSADERRLDRIDRGIQALLQQGEITMSDLTRLQADVTADTDAVSSAATLLGQLAQDIRDAGTDPAALAALADTLEQNTAALSAAVAANTPAAPAAPAPFVTKIAGETFTDYQVRLVNYNASVPIADQAPSLDETAWNAQPASA